MQLDQAIFYIVAVPAFCVCMMTFALFLKDISKN